MTRPHVRSASPQSPAGQHDLSPSGRLVGLLAGLAGVVAAILPSRRAAKLNVLRAIVTE